MWVATDIQNSNLYLLDLHHNFKVEVDTSHYAIGVVLGEVLHIIFIIPMTVNDVNLYVAFRGVSGLNS
jgi:hypothetical protein